jgi:hypothetical protein
MQDNKRTAPNELGETFAEGDEAFSHYSMRTGVVGPIGEDGWFPFRTAGHMHDTFDGTRICSLAHARKMGWLS